MNSDSRLLYRDMASGKRGKAGLRSPAGSGRTVIGIEYFRPLETVSLLLRTLRISGQPGAIDREQVSSSRSLERQD
jgi:hypothetical protein